ncbi:trypsin-like peptidase domain-containing protein [Kitasatospora sp. GP82]|uniref:S1C family serine protease n=1 Tax=Kitasatospora sp. GP82 TaxID=3035089 RepID=UPI0024731BA8|nr:trypsin-like peptidase domain-containing protein [Kitasatospora sp. GP82]MDH6126314.1 putative serine protease PepD [Kitasatospora sp. GP82]
MSDQHRTNEEQTATGPYVTGSDSTASHDLGHWPPPQPEAAAAETATGQAPADRAGRGFLKGRLALVTAVAAVAAVLGGAAGGTLVDHRASTTSSTTLVSPVAASSDGTANVSAIAAAVSPSVVQITVKTTTGTATGTGVVLTSGGQILTNYHVISGAVSDDGRITVTFHDGSTASGTVTGTDKSMDVAVINVSGAGNLTPAALGNSDSTRVGDPVVAIGNPEGLTGTVTSGIISAKNRPVTVQVDEGSTRGNGGFGFPFLPGQRGGGSSSAPTGDTANYKALQTDAALNPGNSGGPLINSSGQVIGLNSAMYSGSGSSSSSDSGSAGSVGLGFAIPINTIKQVLPKLQAGQNL